MSVSAMTVKAQYFSENGQYVSIFDREPTYHNSGRLSGEPPQIHNMNKVIEITFRGGGYYELLYVPNICEASAGPKK